MRRLSFSSGGGFTLTELITVIVIIGVIAAAAIPRLVGRQGAESRAFFDECQAVVRHAQKVAIAQRRPVFVNITSARIGICYDAGCANHVPAPVGFQLTTNSAAANCLNDPNWLCAGAPPDVTVSAAVANFSFNGLGQPSVVAPLIITVAGDINRTFTVERETGYVHP